MNETDHSLHTRTSRRSFLIRDLPLYVGGISLAVLIKQKWPFGLHSSRAEKIPFLFEGKEEITMEEFNQQFDLVFDHLMRLEPHFATRTQGDDKVAYVETLPFEANEQYFKLTRVTNNDGVSSARYIDIDNPASEYIMADTENLPYFSNSKQRVVRYRFENGGKILFTLSWAQEGEDAYSNNKSIELNDSYLSKITKSLIDDFNTAISR